MSRTKRVGGTSLWDDIWRFINAVGALCGLVLLVIGVIHKNDHFILIGMTCILFRIEENTRRARWEGH